MLWAGTTIGAGPRRRAELLRTDSVGTVLWRRAQGWSFADYQQDAIYTNTGTVLLSGGYPAQVGTQHWAVRLLEVDAQGDSLRGALLYPRGAGVSVAPQYGLHRLVALADGGFVLPCDGDTTLPGGRVLLQPQLLKVDRQLRLQWVSVYRPPVAVNTRFASAVALSDGSVLVLAFDIQAVYTYYLLHYGAQGQLLARYPITTPLACPQPVPVRLVPDATGRRLLVAGACETRRGAYVGLIDLGNLPSVVTAAAKPAPPPVAFEVYPNPAQQQATVRVLRAGTVRLLDATGRVVQQQAVRAGQNRLDLTGLPAGLYACQLEQDGRVVATERLQVVH